jgi:4-carboxymuconolactone decarboxylase
MARISYVQENTHPELASVIQTIREQRRGKLIPVYGLLLHTPEIAQAWMGFINAVRWKNTLTERLREIVILRVAVLNDAAYVIDVHRQHFAVADGLTAAECDALLETQIVDSTFSALELAVIDYVDALTLTAQVPEIVFEQVKRSFDERQLVELSVLTGAYNMHTRVLNALQVDNE